MVNLFKKFWRELVVILLAAGFFAACAFFISYVQRDDFVKWASPDETANYVFSKLYAQTGELTIYEKFNPLVDEIMQPRSFRSDGGMLKPVSFLGIILIYGNIAKLTSINVIPYLTPFFSALGIFFFFLLIRKVFSARIALISTCLLACFPVYYYYSVRSMFHNVLFVSLLIIGLYFCVLASMRLQSKNKFFTWRFWRIDWWNLFFAALGGLFIGGALISRTSEAVWLLPALLLAWIFNVKKVGVLKLIVIIAFIALPFVPIMCWNQVLYGGYVKGGYTEMNRSITTISLASTDLTKTVASGKINNASEQLNKITKTIFYFGLNINQSQTQFKSYFVKMFPWLFWPAFLGAILFIFRVWKWKKKYWVFFSSYFVLSLILILYYGSWDFHDNPNVNEITIGNSYTRYWLPIYLGAMPLAAIFISRLSWSIFAPKNSNGEIIINGAQRSWKDFFAIRFPSRDFLITACEVVLLIAFAYFSFNFTAFGSKEGLAYIEANNQTLKSEYRQVMNITETSSVIITSYHDKIFFPERKVIVNVITDDVMNLRYKKLVNLMPVYYYNFTFPDKDFEFLSTIKMKRAGLAIKKVIQTDDVFTLYKIENYVAIPTSTPVLKKPVKVKNVLNKK